MESRVQPHSQTYGRDETNLVRPEAVRPYVCLCALVLAGILPFLARAVNLDEPQYLHVAHSAMEHHWLFPQDTPWIFFGKRYENVAAQTHLPVVEYYLAILLTLIGHFDEMKFRLMFSVFPLLAILSFYRLARRFTMQPLLVSCLFAVSPAFFVLSPTLMMDIPMLAFLLAGLALYLDSLENPRLLWACSVCFILAAGTGYMVLIPMGCLFVWAAATGRPKRDWIAIAAAPVAVAVWLLIMRVHFGQSPGAELLGYYTSHFSFTQILLPMFSFLGGVTVFPWMYLAFVEKSRRWLIAVLSIVLALMLMLFSTNWSSLPYRLWFVFLASSGIGWLFLFALKAAREHPMQKPGYGFLLLWLPVMLVFFPVFAEMMSARYILLILPPLFLVVFHQVPPRSLRYAIAVTMTLSVALAIGDYRFVRSYPDWVRRNVVPLLQQEFHIWSAAESGLRFYLGQNGIQTLDQSDVRPRGGELIVRQSSFKYGLSQDLEPVLVSISRVNLNDAYPVRTSSRDAGAGFHDSHFGLVPFTISRAPIDQLEIAEVSPFVTDLPQAVPEDYSSVPIWFPGGVMLKQIQPEMKFRLRIPRGTRVEYELDGNGAAVLSSDGITLKKDNPGPALWKNFRILPEAWPSP